MISPKETGRLLGHSKLTRMALTSTIDTSRNGCELNWKSASGSGPKMGHSCLIYAQQKAVLG